MTTAAPRRVNYWHQMDVDGFNDVLKNVAAEGLDHLVYNPSAPAQDRIGAILSARLNQPVAIAVADYINNLSVEAGDVGVLLGFGLALTHAQAAEDRLSFQAWLTLAMRRVGLEGRTLTTSFQPNA